MKKSYLIILAIILGIAFIILFFNKKNIEKKFLTPVEITQHCAALTDQDACAKDSWCTVLEIRCVPDMPCTSNFMCYAK